MTDVAVRLIAKYLSDRLKQPFIIDNRPGANGLIAYKAAEGASPDGYTLTMLTSSTSSTFAVTRRANDISDKFRHLGIFYEASNVLIVDPKLPIRSIKDLIAYAKANPGLGYASIGIGSAGHMAMAALAAREGIKMEHIPYRGGVLAVTDLSNGVVPAMFADLGSAASFLKEGKVRPIAVSSKKGRPYLAHVPTAAEQGYPDLTIANFGGLSVPVATPDDITALLANTFEDALKHQTLINRLGDLNLDVAYQQPSDMKKALDDAYVSWRQIAEDNHIRVE